MEFLNLDFAKIFRIETSVLELILRGTLFFLGILLLLRIMPRRTGGELGVMDLIFVILIAEAAANSLGGYSSVTEGFIVIGTLMAWNYLVNVLSYHFPFIEKLVSAPPMVIVKDGKLLRRNMRREYLTEEEVMEQIRKAGFDDVQAVKKAFIESDGTISVIGKEKN
ncbi:DUF421 domain-containing protein [Adhaeribacter soli]|uniref:DUF421 domain-containing protein n=1 Tax=Adhaeribacter soli TaxID=2607655 RepID=A0A5N1J9L7_9BACT|nr:YetF domain-containing protein [Adhaeribacter soli]KAA9345688.1 DUF421 domain-containing protein [Adhaeribacter soli]